MKLLTRFNLFQGAFLWFLEVQNRVRLCVLIRQGLRIGRNVYISKTANIAAPFPNLITIGDNSTITDGVCILAHDASGKKHGLPVKKGKVTIGYKTFIGANSTILPNVIIGNNVIIGAGSVVTRNISSGSVAVGNPAKVIYSVKEYIEKRQSNLEV